MSRKKFQSLEEQERRQAILQAIRYSAGGRRNRRGAVPRRTLFSSLAALLLTLITIFALLGLLNEFFL